MIPKLLLSLIFVSLISTSFGQKSAKSWYTPTSYGIAYSFGDEKNFLFDDLDYFYESQSISIRLSYPLTSIKSLILAVVVQPQVYHIQHQLLNEQFVRPTEENYINRRKLFTTKKRISLTALTWSIEAKQPLFTSFSLFMNIGLGLGYIDTETERLAQGFTFIENGDIGLEITLNAKTSFQVYMGLRHVSNFNTQLPNSGYNTVNTGLSINHVFN
jgi:hypothetical protein